MTAYYNEFDPDAAAWLEELIRQGHIAPGHVDTRSIEDVRPDDLRGYTQCHFFAGIGVWSYALRRAGWADDRPIWTGSCPCQPFSAAGKGAAFDDERHLWPAFHHLIKVGKPAIVLGEQVASSAVDAWIDLVHADMEALDYAFGSIPFPSAGVGAPHIRDRNYWVAESSGQRRQRRQGASYGSLGDGHDAGRVESNDGLARTNKAGLRLADPNDSGRQRGRSGQASNGRDTARFELGRLRHVGGLGDAAGAAGERDAGSVPGAEAEVDRQGRADGCLAVGLEHAGASLGSGQPGPTNGYWSDADWLGCRDGKWRPVEPGSFPLAHGAPARVVPSSDSGVSINAATGEARVMRLRGYGNAINAAAAQAFISTVMEVISG